MQSSQIEQPVAEYLRTGLRLGRLIPGYVDSWTGDGALASEVAAEPEPEPGAIIKDAEATLAAVADSDLDPQRQEFLTAQLRAMAHTAGRLAGEPSSLRAEVEHCFDISLTTRSDQHYQALHDELDGLLPGPDTLHERLVAYRRSLRVPEAALPAAVAAVAEALRADVGPRLGLPPAEQVDYAVVRDRPWNAFNEYVGGFRSRISLNADAGHWTTGLAITLTHEAYPGHHAEHCLKEAGLVDRHGQYEHAISLVNTPQALVAEGTAELGLAVALGPGWGTWTEEALRPLGLLFDGHQAELVDGVMWQLTEVRQDATLMLHDQQTAADDVAAFLAHWMLVEPASARQSLRFMADPLWRAYTTTYVEGRRLVSAWLDARPAGQPLLGRYRRLITEPLLPNGLRREIEAPPVTAPARSLVDDSAEQ